MSDTPPLRAALYCRISEDPQNLQAGVERQKADCRAYAERQGWTVVDTFVDNDTPAYNGKQRPGKQRGIYTASSKPSRPASSTSWSAITPAGGTAT